MKISLNHKYQTANGSIVKIIYCCNGSAYPNIGYLIPKHRTDKKNVKNREYHSWSNYGVCCNSDKGLTLITLKAM